MAIVNDIDTIRYQALTKLVELGYNNSLAYELGKTDEDSLEKGLSLIDLLTALEYSDGLNNEEIENILYCLIEIAEINSFPSFPILSNVPKPDIIVGIAGPTGPKGDAGPSGDANVDVISDVAYDNINSTEALVGDVKTFSLGYNPYIASLAGMSITNGYLKEIGASSAINFTASINDGREAIVTQTITSPITPAWTTDPQSFVDSAVVITSRNTRTYTARVDDGTTVDTDSQDVDFVYPIFTGSSATILSGAQIYANLTKLTALIGDKSVAYSFTDEYAYFAFDDAYNDSAIIILDENGDDVTNEFQMDLITVDSGTTHAGGGGTDWTKQYKVYRTIAKTDISAIFQFINVTE